MVQPNAISRPHHNKIPTKGALTFKPYHYSFDLCALRTQSSTYVNTILRNTLSFFI